MHIKSLSAPFLYSLSPRVGFAARMKLTGVDTHNSSGRPDRATHAAHVSANEMMNPATTENCECHEDNSCDRL